MNVFHFDRFSIRMISNGCSNGRCQRERSPNNSDIHIKVLLMSVVLNPLEYASHSTESVFGCLSLLSSFVGSFVLTVVILSVWLKLCCEDGIAVVLEI